MPAETGALEVYLDTRFVRPSTPRRVVEDELDESMHEDIVLDDRPGHESDARVQADFYIGTPATSPRRPSTYRPSSPNALVSADKRHKVTTEDRRAVEERPSGSIRAATSSSSPSSQHQQDAKRAKGNEPDEEMSILSAVLRGADITEVLSPQRVATVCSKYNLTPGDSFDLRDGYDLSDERTQALVISRIKKSQPSMVIGSPPCTMFSRLQQLNLHVHGDSWKAKFEKEKQKAVKHIVLS